MKCLILIFSYRCPAGKIKLHVRPSNHGTSRPASTPAAGVGMVRPSSGATTMNPTTIPRVATGLGLLQNQTLNSSNATALNQQQLSAAGASATNLTNSNQTGNTSAAWTSSGIRFQLVQHGGALRGRLG